MTRGGKRKGAGRKPAAHGETVTIRIPIACLKQIMIIVEKYKRKVSRETK